MGREIQKTRPCIVISPPEMHDCLRTVIVAPITTASRPAPYRVPVSFGGENGLILLDQIRTLDKKRLVKRLGATSVKTLSDILSTLQEVFAE
jgi:mRNA interferase MazF